MLKEITKVKMVIAGREDWDDDDASKFLTFSYWTSGEKHRIYINDYKRRTLGYIDLDDNENVVITSSQGLSKDDINDTINSFFSEYSEEENEFLFEDPAPEETATWEAIEAVQEEKKALYREASKIIDKCEFDLSKMTKDDHIEYVKLHEAGNELLRKEVVLFEKLYSISGNVLVYGHNLKEVILDKRNEYETSVENIKKLKVRIRL